MDLKVSRIRAGIPLYGTRGRRRGVLIAFSFMEFRDNMEEHRRGAEVDCKNLKYLFDEMGFRNLFYNNLTKDVSALSSALPTLLILPLGCRTCSLIPQQ